METLNYNIYEANINTHSNYFMHLLLVRIPFLLKEVPCNQFMKREKEFHEDETSYTQLS
jgi:hypothetical protein